MSANKAKVQAWRKQQASAAEAARQSDIRQRRIMRHLGRETDPVAARWETLRAMLGRIHKEIAPTLNARRAAEEAIFQIKPPTVRTTRTTRTVSGARPSSPVLTAWEFGPGWWEAMTLKEREDRKAGLLVD